LQDAIFGFDFKTFLSLYAYKSILENTYNCIYFLSFSLEVSTTIKLIAVTVYSFDLFAFLILYDLSEEDLANINLNNRTLQL